MKNIEGIDHFLARSEFFYSIFIGMDGRYKYVSPSYDKNFDFRGGSLLGKEFSITLHPEDIKICAEVGSKCFENPESVFPATLRKHNGMNGFVITQWEMKAQFDSNGDPEGIFCIGYNITEHMDTRTRLFAASSELTTKEEQLYEIGFLQSHLVRKPLANIIGLSGIIGNMDVSENVKNLSNMLLNSCKELDDAIRIITERTDSRGNSKGTGSKL
jgi:hypothetical protein